jgi:hypothetical protein
MFSDEYTTLFRDAIRTVVKIVQYMCRSASMGSSALHDTFSVFFSVLKVFSGIFQPIIVMTLASLVYGTRQRWRSAEKTFWETYSVSRRKDASK